MLAFLLMAFMEVGWVFALGAASVAALFLWRDTPGIKRLYRWTSWLIAGGSIVLLFSGGFGFWRRVMFGPPSRSSGPTQEWFEQLNVINFWVLLFFFSAPLWRSKKPAGRPIARVPDRSDKRDRATLDLNK